MAVIWMTCAWCGLGLLSLYSLMQLGWFIGLYRRYGRPRALQGPYLKSAVALTLRGADPFLRNCLAGLLSQDHPDYCVVIMIDSPLDPAAGLVQRILEERPSDKVHVRYVTAPRLTCSLRMEALIQIVEGLDPSYEAIVLCDADTIPHPTWLRELVGALNDPQVGVATGVRWYMPPDKAWGSLVRYIWNFGAVLQMSAFDIGWGGALAIRRESMKDIGLLDQWSRAMFEDTLTVSRHLESNWKLTVVPAATMVNRETVGLNGCVTFITRQLLNARLYHKNWRYVAGSALWMTLATVLVYSPLVAGAILGSVPIVITVVGGIAAYIVANLVGLALLERQIRRLVRSRGETLTLPPLRVVAAAFVAQYLYLYCLYRAMRLGSLEWRGLTYEISGPTRVRLLEYKPYVPHTSTGSLASL